MDFLQHLCRPSPNLEEFSRIVASCFASCSFTQGGITRQFQDAVKEISGASEAIFTSNGTVSLSIALLALGVKPGDIVATTPYSFVASSNAIQCVGAIPVFIDHRDINLDAETIKEFLEQHTVLRGTRLCLNRRLLNVYHHHNLSDDSTVKAILCIDQFGIPCDYDGICAVANKYNLSVVRDAACALGSTYKGKSAINPGEYPRSISSVSFHPRKVITTGEGGMILCNSHNLSNKCKSLVNHGFCDGEYNYVASNARNSDISAALGLAHLQDLSDIVSKRQRILDFVRDSLPRSCQLPLLQGDTLWNVQSLPIICGTASQATKAIQMLAEDNIRSRIAIRPINTLVSYSGFTEYSLNLVRELAGRIILVPCHELMSETHTEQLVQALKAI